MGNSKSKHKKSSSAEVLEASKDASGVITPSPQAVPIAPPAEEINKDEKLLESCMDGDVQRVRELLAAGANASYEKSVDGELSPSPIHYALLTQNEELITLLLDHGANPNAKYETHNSISQTAFQMAISNRAILANPSLLKKFIANGANVNEIMWGETKNSNITTNVSPLHTAVQEKSIEITRMLLEAGAEVNAMRNSHGEKYNGLYEDTSETSLHIACSETFTTTSDPVDLQLVALLVKHGADVNAQRKFLENEPLRRMRQAGEHISKSYRSVETLSTPLHLAVKGDKADLVRVLILLGADRNIPYVYGDDKINTFDIESSPATKAALYNLWKPEFHKYYPTPIKEAVLSILIIAKREHWKFDKIILLNIISFMASSWPLDEME